MAQQKNAQLVSKCAIFDWKNGEEGKKFLCKEGKHWKDFLEMELIWRRT